MLRRPSADGATSASSGTVSQILLTRGLTQTNPAREGGLENLPALFALQELRDLLAVGEEQVLGGVRVLLL